MEIISPVARGAGGKSAVEKIPRNVISGNDSVLFLMIRALDGC
jgi:hypothetical protein